MIVAELDQRAYSFRINIVGSYYGRQRMLARLGTYELENLDLAIHSSPVAHHLLPLHECFYVDEMHALNKLVTAKNETQVLQRSGIRVGVVMVVPLDVLYR